MLSDKHVDMCSSEMLSYFWLRIEGNMNVFWHFEGSNPFHAQSLPCILQIPCRKKRHRIHSFCIIKSCSRGVELETDYKWSLCLLAIIYHYIHIACYMQKEGCLSSIVSLQKSIIILYDFRIWNKMRKLQKMCQVFIVVVVSHFAKRDLELPDFFSCLTLIGQIFPVRSYKCIVFD